MSAADTHLVGRLGKCLRNPNDELHRKVDFIMYNKTMDLQITFWGGVGTVTGANFLMENSRVKILVDCGLLQGVPGAGDENQKQFPYDPKTINLLFITHAHMDHIGRVGKLVRDGFRGTIYSTPETREIADAMIQDALKVMDDKNSEMIAPLYDMDDFNETMRLWKTIPYHAQTDLPGGFSVYLKDAGHILGAAMYEFSHNGKKIVFTGDSGNSPSPLLRDTEKITDANYLIMDSVYGDRNHEPKEERDAKFEKVIKETIAKGGTVLIPSFSIERTQVMLYELNNLVENKKVPSVPVFLDSPLGEKVTQIYAHSTQDFNPAVQNQIKQGDNIFNFPKLSITHSRGESQKIALIQGPKIIISGSGMSSGGRVMGHEIHYLPDPKNTLLLVGFQAVGTLGRRIQEKPKEVEIQGQTIPVKARIEMISGYSSHKDSDHLVAMVEDTEKSLKKAFVVMGEPKSSMHIVQRLRDELEIDAVYPERGRVYELN